MSLVPVRSIRAAIGARKMHSDLTTEFTKAIVGVLPIVFLIMVWAWYLRLSGSGLKTLSLDYSRTTRRSNFTQNHGARNSKACWCHRSANLSAMRIQNGA